LAPVSRAASSTSGDAPFVDSHAINEANFLDISRVKSSKKLVDWSDALKTALSAAPGTKIHFPSGTILINADPYDANDGISLLGAPNNGTVIKINPESCLKRTASIKWKNSSNIVVKNIIFDLSGCSPIEAHAPFLNFVRDHGVVIAGNSFINVGAHWNIIAINGTQNAVISNNSANAEPSRELNHFVSLSTSGGRVSNVTIEKNRSRGTGFLVAGSNVKVLGNDISGWAYGGGVTVTRGVTPDVIVADNNIHNSGQEADSDRTYANGIEAWSKGAIIFRNIIKDVGASCVFSGGNDQKIIQNVCVGAGKGLRQSGFVAGFVTNENSANGSLYAGNRAEPDMSGSMPYGFSAIKGNKNISLDSNSFEGSQGKERSEAGHISHEKCFEISATASIKEVENLPLSQTCPR
jgi:hypothetical protein